MNINPVSPTDASKVIAPTTAMNAVSTGTETTATNKIPSQTRPQPATDTVALSSAAKAAAEEATETSAQTAREALSGDRQAQRLQAKQASAEETNAAAADKVAERDAD